MPGVQVSTLRMEPRRGATDPELRRRELVIGSHIAAEAAPLAPRGVGQILDAAFEIFVARFAVCVAIGAVLMFPIQVGTEVILRSRIDPDVQAFILLLVGLSSTPVQFVTSAFVCAVVGGEVMGERVSVNEALRLALRRVPGIFVIALITGAAAIPLLCLCGVGTALAYWLFAVVPAVYVLEQSGLGTALSRGVKLVWGWGNFGRWFGWYAVATVILLPMTGVSALRSNEMFRGPIFQYVPMLNGPAGFLLTIFDALFMGVALAYPAVLMVVYYTDLRVRREGLDLERELARLEARHGTGAA